MRSAESADGGYSAFRILHSACWALLAMSLWTEGANAAGVKLESVQSSCSTVSQYERCEVTVKLSGKILNPYDPNEISLQGIFKPPQGHPVSVFGFYYQPFERLSDGGRESLQPAGEPVWKIRFSPGAVGRWSQEVRVTTAAGTQSMAAGPFLVVESKHPGFVRFDREVGYLRFDNGRTFIPIGENLCWGPSVQPLRTYDRWLRDLSKQHANYIRLWLAPWSFRLETKETGMGRYDQLRAWELDALLSQSETLGLYWQLCILNHGQFSRNQDPDWHNNPYNVQLGGICRLPNEFLTDPRAKVLFQRLLRYIVSRWGYSPNLATWELFNEGDFGEFRAEDLTTWTAQMSAYLRGLDVHQRPITTSYHGEAPPAVWQAPAMDVIQLHMYDVRDFSTAFAGPTVSTMQQTYRKPVFIGEFGWIDEVVRKFDNLGIHVHDGLWSSIMGGAVGGALVWYWDTYIHPNGLERHLRPLEAFWRDEQIRQPLKQVGVSVSDRDLAGWGLGGAQRTYVWFKNRTHSLDGYLAYRCEVAKQRLRQKRGQAAQAVSYPPRVVRGATATVRGLKWMGRYRVEWWDPYHGRIVGRSVGRAKAGTLELDVPAVTFDVAAKLINLEWWERG